MRALRSLVGARLNRWITDRHVDPMAYRVGVSTIMVMKAQQDRFVDLWDAELRVYSQWGEDGILEFIFDRLGIERPRAIEFGAGNFRECNTRFMAEFRHGSVVAVDGRADLASSTRALPLFWQTSIYPVVEWITPETAPRLLDMANDLLGGIDLLSLDIDGNDYWVLDSLDLAGVRVVVVEYNPLWGGKAAVSVPRDDGFERSTAHFSCLYYGASLRAWIHLLGLRGFTFVGTNRVGNNAFFCLATEAAALGLTLPDADQPLVRHVDWRVRESRDEGGALTFMSPSAVLPTIGRMELVEVTTGRVMTVQSALDNGSDANE